MPHKLIGEVIAANGMSAGKSNSRLAASTRFYAATCLGCDIDDTATVHTPPEESKSGCNVQCEPQDKERFPGAWLTVNNGHSRRAEKVLDYVDRIELQAHFIEVD